MERQKDRKIGEAGRHEDSGTAETGSRERPKAEPLDSASVSGGTLSLLRLFQQGLSLLRRESLDCVSQSGSRNPGAMFEQENFEPRGIRLSGFAQHPARSLVNQIFGIFEQRFGDCLSVLQPLAAPRGMNYPYGRGAAQPQVAFAGPGLQL